jgi:GNAT superfamily N-acetyltransferase
MLHTSPTHPPDATQHVTVEVATCETDQHAYTTLLSLQRRWIEGELGLRLATLQPQVAGEYTNPFRTYARSATAPLLARVAGAPAGICAVRPLSSWVGDVELKRVFVDPRCRGTGVGRHLVEAAVGLARERGARTMVLETHADHMPRALALYRSVGFVDARPLGITHHPGVITLALDLSGPAALRGPVMAVGTR